MIVPASRLHAVLRGTPAAGHPPRWLVAAGLLVGAAMMLPVAYLLVRAVGSGGDAWALLWRWRTLQILGSTVALALAVTAASVALGVAVAWLTHRTDLPGRRWWTIASALPLVVPSYLGAFVFLAAFGPRGLLRDVLGIDVLPELRGFPGALVVLTLFSYPFVALSAGAALDGHDGSLEEASRLLGRTAWGTFWRVTVPQLRPAVTAGALLVGLYVLSDFGAISLVQFDSFTQVIYTQYRGSLDRSLAALLALLLVVLTAVVVVLERRTRGPARFHRFAPGVRRRLRATRLRQWTPLGVLVVAGLATLTLVVPVAVLAYWWLRGTPELADGSELWQAAANSALAAGLAAAITVLAALPVALLACRYRGRASAWLQAAVYSSQALPGIVIALALVFFAANYAPVVYQTLPLLLFAYVVRFQPHASGPLRGSLVQITPTVEEAARTLGQSPAQALRRVTLPLARPGLQAGAALVLLGALKELPATLLLAPTGFGTLATRTWGFASEGFFALAAAHALVLMLLATVPMVFLARRGIASE
ncbi:MAG: iron ABC transporter permease [Actinobacteria bacterium]|nr:iron ABC transporter permease [Actinomycetota bacterium]